MQRTQYQKLRLINHGESTIKINNMSNQKIKVTFSENDLDDLRNSDVLNWTFKTDKGENIDLELGLGDCCEVCDEEYLINELDNYVCGDCQLITK